MAKLQSLGLGAADELTATASVPLSVGFSRTGRGRRRRLRRGNWQPDSDYALAFLGRALITERSKELTDSGDRNTEATSGSSTIATVPPFISDAKRFGRDRR